MTDKITTKISVTHWPSLLCFLPKIQREKQNGPDFIYVWDACEWWEKDLILNVYKVKNPNEVVNIDLIHFSNEACGLFSLPVWSLGQNFDASSTAPINTPHPPEMGFSNSLINIRHFWYLKYSRGGTNSHIFYCNTNGFSVKYFLRFTRTHTPPVLKIVDRSGNETFGSIHIQENLSSAPGTRPGPDPTLGGVTKVYIFALSHSNFPRGHDGRVKCERRGAEPDTFGISTPPGLLPV